MTVNEPAGQVMPQEPNDAGQAAMNPGAAARTTCPSCGGATAPMQPCPNCGNSSSVGPRHEVSRYVYALGRVESRFPSLAAEKEFSQAVGRAETARLSDREALHAVLTQRQNRYLIRQLCWVLTIQGLDTYILQPRDPSDLDLLIEAIRPVPSPEDQDVVIGLRGGIAPPEMCNGLTLPMVHFDQIYSFDRTSLIDSIPRPDTVAAKEFRSAAAEIFDRVIQMAGNSGATDAHRAMNYLAVRYPAIYAKTAEAFGQDMSLMSVDVQPSSLSGSRNIIEVIFAFTNRKTDVTEKYFVRVDITEEFPFLVTKLTPYFDR